jgi:hypothetical protein
MSSHILPMARGLRAVRQGGKGSGLSGFSREKLVEPAFGIERDKIVTAADVRAVDEDLRHGVSTRRFYHRWPVSGIRFDIQLLPLHAFALEELLRPAAKRT